MNRDIRLAIELSKINPAWKGLRQMSRPVDTLILGDSVARVNLSAAQWHAMGLGDVMNLGNTGVSGVKTDVMMLQEYQRRFHALPYRVVVARHLGSYLDDLPSNWRQKALIPLAAAWLKRNGGYPYVPVVNDVRPPGLPADEQLVNSFVRLAPKWLVGPFAWSEENLYYTMALLKLAPWVVFVPGPVCGLVLSRARVMRDEFGMDIERMHGRFMPELHTYRPTEMQDPNHLSPDAALKWSREIAEGVKRL